MNVNEISKNLFNVFESDVSVKHEVVQYPGILALFALLKTAENTNDEALKEKVLGYIRQFPESTNGKKYNFQSYKIGGIAAAYAFYKGNFLYSTGICCICTCIFLFIKKRNPLAKAFSGSYFFGDWMDGIFKSFFNIH